MYNLIQSTIDLLNHCITNDIFVTHFNTVQHTVQ